jgi:hypothetical protein
MTAPNHVAILGLGPSLAQYMAIARGLGGRSAYCDEVWAINNLGDVFQCDRIFHMDDVRIQEIRAAAAPDSNIANMLRWMRRTPARSYTSRAHPDYPGLVEFPLEDVINDLGFAYLNNTAAYAVAYAIHIGVKKISLYGCDFTYPNAHDAEKGRACVEYWLGFAKARGIQDRDREHIVPDGRLRAVGGKALRLRHRQRRHQGARRRRRLCGRVHRARDAASSTWAATA